MRMGDVARFARARPRTQQAGVVAGLALLVSAPFGGLAAVDEPGPAGWTPHQPFGVGPFEVTVVRAVTVPDLGPTIRPATEGNRLVAVVTEIENVSDRMAYLTLLTRAVLPRGSGIVDDDDPTTPTGVSSPDVYIVKDTSVPQLLNPGVGLRVILVWEQDADAPDAGRVRLDVAGYDFVEESALTLDQNYWLLDDEVALSGEVDFAPVEDDG